MIYKSYLIEQNLESLTEKVVLFYGENFGLKHEFKKKIKNRSLENETFDFYQEEIIKDESSKIKELVTDNQNKSENNNSENSNLEKSILEKINN